METSRLAKLASPQTKFNSMFENLVEITLSDHVLVLSILAFNVLIKNTEKFDVKKKNEKIRVNLYLKRIWIWNGISQIRANHVNIVTCCIENIINFQMHTREISTHGLISTVFVVLNTT